MEATDRQPRADRSKSEARSEEDEGNERERDATSRDLDAYQWATLFQSQREVD